MSKTSAATGAGEARYTEQLERQLDRALASLAASRQREEAARKALNLALSILIKLEPRDSRAVSDEFVAMAAVASGDASATVMAVIDAALSEKPAAEKEVG